MSCVGTDYSCDVISHTTSTEMTQLNPRSEEAMDTQSRIQYESCSCPKIKNQKHILISRAAIQNTTGYGTVLSKATTTYLSFMFNSENLAYWGEVYTVSTLSTVQK